MRDSNNIPILKIITLGNSSVGKTSIIKQYTNKTFEADLINTIGIDLKMHDTIIENIPIKVKIWDTAGQERFRSLQKQYYNQVDGILFVFDITNRESFNIIPVWLEKVKENSNEGVIGILLGNKSDLDDMREISFQEGKKLGDDFNFKYFEISAFNGNHVDEAINSLLYDIMINKGLINKNKEKDDLTNNYENIKKGSNNIDEDNKDINDKIEKNENKINRNSFKLKEENTKEKPKNSCCKK